MNSRSFSFRQPELEQLRLLAEAETGMDLAGSRLPRLESALERVLMQQPGLDLAGVLERPEIDPGFMESLTAELTVGETFFFRNEHHFKALREHIFPEILRDNAAQREIRVWSAGCATGEEPYSIAILLDQMLAGRDQWQVSILGTDLNPSFQERARQARFRKWSFRLTDIHQDRRYFTPDGEWFVMNPRVSSPVRFAYLNLVKDVYPSPMTGTLGLDLILFRNVAIYLRPEVTKAIIQRFLKALRPGGWLLLGEAELPLSATTGFQSRQFNQATFFRKPTDALGEPDWVGSSMPSPLMELQSTDDAVGLTVPTLPEWAPLPWSNAGEVRSTPPRNVTESTSSPWEQVERCLSQKDYAGAELVLDRISSPKERAQYRLRCIGQLLGVAEFARARGMLEVCLRDDPLLIEGQLWKACFAEEAGNLAAAEQAYRHALYIDRKCPMAHFLLASVLQQKGDLVGARRSLDTTMDLIRGKPPHALVEYGEGICYGRLQEMVTLTTRGFYIAPGNSRRSS